MSHESFPQPAPMYYPAQLGRGFAAYRPVEGLDFEDMMDDLLDLTDNMRGIEVRDASTARRTPRLQFFGSKDFDRLPLSEAARSVPRDIIYDAIIDDHPDVLEPMPVVYVDSEAIPRPNETFFAIKPSAEDQRRMYEQRKRVLSTIRRVVRHSGAIRVTHAVDTTIVYAGGRPARYSQGSLNGIRDFIAWSLPLEAIAMPLEFTPQPSD